MYDEVLQHLPSNTHLDRIAVHKIFQLFLPFWMGETEDFFQFLLRIDKSNEKVTQHVEIDTFVKNFSILCKSNFSQRLECMQTSKIVCVNSVNNLSKKIEFDFN